MAPRQIAIALILLGAAVLCGQELPLPVRAPDAPGGSAVAAQIASLPIDGREAEITRQVLAGNVPNFMRRLCPVSVTNVSAGVTNRFTFFVTPDYLCVGSDADFFFTPLRPRTAQELAERLDCALPTRQMVDAIYAAAPLKLAPLPIQPSPQMTTVPVFQAHNEMVRTQRLAFLNPYPLGTLTAGDKKDVVISARLESAPGKVAIYGWHKTNGAPIQPLYLGHTAEWADYSHGIRLARQDVLVNGTNASLRSVLANEKWCALLSDEGPVEEPRYPFFGERITEFTAAPGAHVEINAPAPRPTDSNAPTLLIFYALPNGNSIAQTAGRKSAPGEDWRYDIQHIAAQTRFLRAVVTNKIIVVAYLEATGKSWPEWRRTHADQEIPAIIDVVKNKVGATNLELALASHSGGGSFVFGYLNVVEPIPPEITRIAFLDSDYAYAPALGYSRKLALWLRDSTSHALCVLAYDDAAALLDGKPFVTPSGGTWGRSHAMLADFSAEFTFSSATNSIGLETYSTLAGRLSFFLLENPERKILHTVQVERNGFIHTMLAGTPLKNSGYEYFGPRAYTNWIR